MQKGFHIKLGSETKYFSIIYVKDLAEGLIVAAESDKSEGQKYSLCNEKPTSYDEICKLTATALERKTINIIIPSFLLEASALLAESYAKMKNTRPLMRRKGFKAQTKHWVCDGSKAKSELRYQPKTSLADGIKMTAVWYLKHGWI